MLLQNREMATHPAFLGFVGDWTIMMAAMMLPSFAPIASRYSKMVDSRRWLGMIGVVIGYVGVWSITGCFTYFVAQLITASMSQAPKTATTLAVSIFAVGGAISSRR